MNDLDAMRYFLLSSSLVIGITALLFFVLGLWLGYLVWAVYKKQFIKRGQIIEALKSENAMLKRRVAEPASRYLPASSTKPTALQTIASGARRQVEQMDIEPLPVPETSPLPPAAGFSIWTEQDWMPTMVTAPTNVNVANNVAPAIRLPLSRAMSIWTEEGWRSNFIPLMPMPAGRAFTVWTSEDFVPVIRRSVRSSEAFSVWTEAGWEPRFVQTPPLPSSEAFTVWTDADFVPVPQYLLRASEAFSLWTEASWQPPVLRSMPQPLSAAFTLWMIGDHVPHFRHSPPASNAFSIWSEVETLPVSREGRSILPSRAFSLWTQEPPAPAAPLLSENSHRATLAAVAEEVMTISAAPQAGRVVEPTHGTLVTAPLHKAKETIIPKYERRGFFVTRALAVVRIIFGGRRSDDHAKVDEVAAATKPELPVLPSRAFSIWTEPGWEGRVKRESESVVPARELLGAAKSEGGF